ncbi:MAG: hypothetical protein ABSG80_09275 [Verrucomicrobiota bacterium]|jgi:hypothetical protein
MKLKKNLGWSSALCLCVPLCGIAQAQETNQPADFDQRLIQMQERFEQREREMEARFDKKTAAQDAEIEALKQQLAGTATNPPAPVFTGTPSTNTVTPEQLKDLNAKVDQVAAAQKKTLMSEFNPAIGLVGETIFSYNSKGSDQNGNDRPGGFDVFQRSIELNVAASVDPFAKGYAVINASADSATGDANLGVEEAALQTTSLPGNLELKAGRFFGEFGRLGYIHDHELPFVNRPLVLDQYIGGESRSDGAQVNWLAPVSHYISLTAGVGDSFGGDSPNPDNPGTYRAFDGLNFWGRLSTYFDLTPDWQLETGVSGLINPKTADRGGALLQPNGISTLTEKERRLAGFDMKLSCVPLQNNQFQSFTWGTEVLYSDNRYLSDPDGIPNNSDEFDENVGSVGLYSYVTYKWSRQWSAGFLFDWVQSGQNNSEVTSAYSPYITWAISHWNQLRLQYTHTDQNAASGLRPNDAIYLQWAWIIGSHSHGWQQR